MKRKMSKSGFTLIEILVSVGIISFIVLVIVQAFISTVRTNTKTEALRDIKQNGDYAMNTMIRMVQNAQAINTPAGASATLNITNQDGLQTTFYADSNCRIASESAFAPVRIYLLTGPDLVVEGSPCQLSFNITQLYGKPAAVSISFSLQQKNAAGTFEQADMQFRTSTDVRNIDL